MQITIDTEKKTIRIDGNYTYNELERLMNDELKAFKEFKIEDEYVELPYVPVISKPYIIPTPIIIPYEPPQWPLRPYVYCGGTAQNTYYSNTNADKSNFTNFKVG